MTLLTFPLALVLAPTPAENPEPAAPEEQTAEPVEEGPDAAQSRFDAPYRRHSIGTSAFVLMNVIPLDDRPSFYQLNYAYRITPKDVISVEAITWKYYGPIGRQYWDSGDNYPGSVRSVGVGVAYQRFLWRGLYVGAHALPLLQTYLDVDNKKIQRGFQLFLTARLGYHVQLFNNRVFIEPSVAFTSWPIYTNLPDSFAQEEDKWSKFFLFEPGLHFGVKF
ncbi:MAG: hypothetical protein JKY37_28510 [Nannocystaceae bacterium]|nr:hypothetical protein [Nannocystaceae bacterium]